MKTISNEPAGVPFLMHLSQRSRSKTSIMLRWLCAFFTRWATRLRFFRIQAKFIAGSNPKPSPRRVRKISPATQPVAAAAHRHQRADIERCRNCPLRLFEQGAHVVNVAVVTELEVQ